MEIAFNAQNYNPKACEERLIERGYIWTEVTGWEKPELLESFGLNPNELQNGIPAYLKPEMDVEEKRGKKRDEFGNSTGDFIEKKYLAPTGKYKWYPSINYLAFKYYKKHKENLNLTPKEIINVFKECEKKRNNGELIDVDRIILGKPSM
jgi:hypothetical protein